MVDEHTTISNSAGEIVIPSNMTVDLGGSSDTFAIATSDTMTFSIDNIVYSGDNYGGCEECYRLSMLFGSPSIVTEEDFERTKEIFVNHFNKKHRDLLMKKGLPLSPKTFKKIPKMELAYEAEYDGRWSNRLTTLEALEESEQNDIREQLRHTISTAYGIPIIMTTNPANGIGFFHTQGSREPEYVVAPDRHVEFMDRQSRFREGLRA